MEPFKKFSLLKEEPTTATDSTRESKPIWYSGVYTAQYCITKITYDDGTVRHQYLGDVPEHLKK